MGTESFIGWQFGMTLIAVLLFGLWLFMRIRRRQSLDAEARQHGQPEKHSALAQSAHAGERAAAYQRREPATRP